MKRLFLAVVLLLMSCAAHAIGTLTITKSSATLHPAANVTFTYLIDVTCVGNCFDVDVWDSVPVNFTWAAADPTPIVDGSMRRWTYLGLTNTTVTIGVIGFYGKYEADGVINTVNAIGSNFAQVSDGLDLDMATATVTNTTVCSPTFTITPICSPTFTYTNVQSFTNTPVCSPTFTPTFTKTITKTVTPTITFTITPNTLATRTVWKIQTQTAIAATRTAVVKATQTAVAATKTEIAAAGAVLTATANATPYARATAAQQTALATKTQIAQTATAVSVATVNAQLTRIAAAAQTQTVVATTMAKAWATRTAIVAGTQTAVAATKTAVKTNFLATASATFTKTSTFTTTHSPTKTHTPTITPTFTKTPDPNGLYTVPDIGGMMIANGPAYLSDVIAMQWTITATGLFFYNATSPTGCTSVNYMFGLTTTAAITGATTFPLSYTAPNGTVQSMYFSRGIGVSSTASGFVGFIHWRKATLWVQLYDSGVYQYSAIELEKIKG